jgi:TolB-like protein
MQGKLVNLVDKQHEHENTWRRKECLLLVILLLAVCCTWMPTRVLAGEPPVAVFPFQELDQGRNDANLAFTKALAEGLAEKGNEIINSDAVMSFMSNNRIRTVGRLETYRIAQARNELGVDFVLLGTVTQRKEQPEASMGLTLDLVRTSDARTVWSYCTNISTGEDRKPLGIGEPQTTAEIQPLLIADVVEHWPWQLLHGVRQVRAINIDTAILEPKYLKPGEEVHARVRLHENWSARSAPRVFFKAGDQLYPAKVSADGDSTYEGSWVAGKENGRVTVSLVLEWSDYGRTDSALLGNYLVDGTPPVLAVELRRVTMIDGKPVFSRYVKVVPHLLVHKILSRWRLGFYYENGTLVGEMNGLGNLPDGFIWQGTDTEGPVEDGKYRIDVEVWDRAGNEAEASKWVILNRSKPQVDLAVAHTDKGMVVGLKNDGKIPLASWRMEMWTKDGRLLQTTGGKQLPAKFDIKLAESEGENDLRGTVVFRDVLGNLVKKKVQDLLPDLIKEAKQKALAKAKAEAEKKEASGLSKKWVDEF